MSLRGLGQQFLICMYIQLILPGQGSDFSLAQTSNDSPGRNLTLTVAQLEGHVKTWRSGVIILVICAGICFNGSSSKHSNH